MINSNAILLAGILFCVLSAWPKSVFAYEGRFRFQDVISEAKQLSLRAFSEQPDDQIPDFLKKINYDQWRDIRFKNSNTLWQNDREHFKIRFFHLGFYYQQPVIINYVENGVTHQLPFSPDLFDYGKNDFKTQVPPGLGFAGFRIHYPINTPSYDDEIAVFLGASYFRAVAKGLLYGLSARGLAINTALDGGEEFPFFKEFWIIKPYSHDRQIEVDALLDSPSVAGAYEFIIHPGKETTMKVNSSLFIRKKVEKLGIAPMTSMFFYGLNSKSEGHEDYRLQVHDSDGVSILTKWKEWIWRPLVNPKQLLINTFEVATPLGFGLFQRDQDFDHYQDLEARYELRPSLWVTPQKDWGKGHVELVQIPSGDEKNDNINLFWVPQKSPEPGEELNFSYTLQWCSAKTKVPPLGFVTDTFVVRPSDKKGARFVIDFQGLKRLPSGISPTADISLTNGYKILQQQVIRNTVTGGWRLVFQIQNQGAINEVMLDKGPAVDVRAFLKDGPDVLTETWDYAWMP